MFNSVISIYRKHVSVYRYFILGFIIFLLKYDLKNQSAFMIEFSKLDRILENNMPAAEKYVRISHSLLRKTISVNKPAKDYKNIENSCFIIAKNIAIQIPKKKYIGYPICNFMELFFFFLICFIGLKDC